MAAPSDDVEMQKIAEDELAKLQRQFRIMEIDRLAVSSGAQPTLRVQRQLLRLLNQELGNIMLELKLTRSPSNLAESSRVRSKLSALLRDHDQLSGAVRGERRQIQEIDFLLRQVQKEIKTLHNKDERVDEDLSTALTNQTIVSQLENRLDTTTKRYNAVSADNLRMRQDIDRLLHDRQSFNNVWQGLVKKLTEGKSQILELVEQSIMTYEQREEWCTRLDQLKEKAASDYRKHCLEVRDLQRQLDYRLKLEEFLRTKGTTRLPAVDARAEARRLEKQERERRKYDNYVATLEAIKEFTGESDVDKVVQEFRRREEENYALFNYVNEVNCELRLIHDSVNNLRNNLEEERGRHEAMAERQQESADSLRDALGQQQVRTRTAEQETRRSRDVLHALLAAVHEIAISAKCEALPLVRLVGASARVDVASVQLYLQCVEKRIREILQLITADEILCRQASAKDKTPPASTRRKSSVPRSPRPSPRRSPRRSPRDQDPPASRGNRDQLLLAAP